ncbi:hypothetical protein BGS_0419 [Beggiatoa sp. SS]|nr:hypothetical protein BGS_0419 [Beggiatoa sp. SS]
MKSWYGDCFYELFADKGIRLTVGEKPITFFKSVSVAQEKGYLCIPVVIAESWRGDLKSLNCEHLIYIQANPNQLDQIAPKLAVIKIS